MLLEAYRDHPGAVGEFVVATVTVPRGDQGLLEWWSQGRERGRSGVAAPAQFIVTETGQPCPVPGRLIPSVTDPPIGQGSLQLLLLHHGA